jgi:hypothetical protein
MPPFDMKCECCRLSREAAWWWTARDERWQWAASPTSGTSSRPLTGIGRQKRPRRTVQVSQGWYSGIEAAVGSLTDLWHKLQASNRDRQAEEAKADNAGESMVV